MAAAAEHDDGEWADAVEFMLGGDRYALEFKFVAEVFHPEEIILLPGAPPFLIGVINLRGRIVPVVNLKAVLGIQGGRPLRPAVIVLAGGEGEIGLLADEISGVVKIMGEEMRPLLSGAKKGAQAYFAGASGGDLTVLDGKKILEDRGLIVDEEA